MVVALALLTATLAAAAQPPPEKPDRVAMKAARPFAEEGFALFRKGEYAASIEAFRRAEARFHAPPHMLYIARAQVQLDRLIAARETYWQILGEKLDSAAPPAFRRAVLEARAEIGEVRDSIPFVTLVLSGSAAAETTVSVDGKPHGNAPKQIELDPGQHVFELSAPGGVSTRRRVTLARSSHQELHFDTGGTEAQPDALWWPAMAAFGTGGVALVIGTITGLISLEKAADIEAQCVDSHCPAALEGEAATAATLGNVSTAMFVVASLAGGTGLTLLLLHHDDGADSTAAVQLDVGPGALSLRGSF